MQMKNVMTSLKNSESRISPEILKQCSLNLAPEKYITKDNGMACVILFL